MSNKVSPEAIEALVGTSRKSFQHYARANSAEKMVYVLHSQECFDNSPDLTLCAFSVALDNGIDEKIWKNFLDRPIRVVIRDNKLVPVP